MSPEFALAGQEPFSQQAPVALEDPGLGEVAGVLDEDVLDQGRISEQVLRLAHEAQPHYVRVLSDATGEKAQRVSRVLPYVATEEASLGVGRSVRCPHHFFPFEVQKP
jgi:hypothetical protein